MKKAILYNWSHTYAIAFCLLIGCSTVSSAQEVRSDYEIQKSYKQQVQALNKAVEQAHSINEIDSLKARINSLEKNFAEHRSLINKVIHPDTFEEQIQTLHSRSNNRRQFLASIRQKEQELEKMTKQLTTYRSRLNTLTNRADSLKSSVQRSERSQNQLATEVEYYKNQLRERDELILSFIDSVVVNYQKLAETSFSEIEETTAGNRLQVDGTPLELIHSISRESTELLTSTTAFTTEDYLRMKRVNNEFTRMWQIVGEDLSEIYSSSPAQSQQEILRSIHEWKQALDDRLWTSLQQSFEESGITLSEFHSDSAFFSALNSYVNRAAAKSKENNGGETYQKFTTFTDFWNNVVKQKWTDNLTRAEVLSSTQIAQIDQKVNQWSSLAKPESNLLAYLLGGSLLAIAVLGFMLFQEKRNSVAGKSDSNPKSE